jgi:hypothetical protein
MVAVWFPDGYRIMYEEVHFAAISVRFLFAKWNGTNETNETNNTLHVESLTLLQVLKTDIGIHWFRQEVVASYLNGEGNSGNVAGR